MDQSQLASLRSSSSILLMRHSLRSAGAWSIFWGLLWLGVLLVRISSGPVGWLNYLWLGFGGALLIAEGVFVITRFNSTALKAEAITLAAFGVLNLYSFAMMAAGKSNGRANPIFGIIMLFNAFTTGRQVRRSTSS